MSQYTPREDLKRTAFNTLYFLKVQQFLRNKKLRNNQITLLCLHKVSSDYDYFWDPIKPESFDCLVRYLVKYYDIISISDVGATKPGKRPKVILSFDDGYYDFYTHVLPVLRGYSIPANHNIVTDIVNGTQDVIWTEKLNFLFNHFRQNRVNDVVQVGNLELKIGHQSSLNQTYILFLKELFKMDQASRLAILDAWFHKFGLHLPTPKMMGWNEIHECAKHGVEFGSHTKTHPILTSEKNEVILAAELVQSKAEIEKNLGTPVTILAPPNGLCNNHILKLSANAGYKYILGIGERSGIEKKYEGLTCLLRLNLISEPHSNMVLRIEELQGSLKGYFKK